MKFLDNIRFALFMAKFEVACRHNPLLGYPLLAWARWNAIPIFERQGLKGLIREAKCQIDFAADSFARTLKRLVPQPPPIPDPRTQRNIVGDVYYPYKSLEIGDEF